MKNKKTPNRPRRIEGCLPLSAGPDQRGGHQRDERDDDAEAERLKRDELLGRRRLLLRLGHLLGAVGRGDHERVGRRLSHGDVVVLQLPDLLVDK